MAFGPGPDRLSIGVIEAVPLSHLGVVRIDLAHPLLAFSRSRRFTSSRFSRTMRFSSSGIRPRCTAPAQNTTSVSATISDNAVSGDVTIASYQFGGGSNVTPTPPSGWTQVGRRDHGTSSSAVLYRKVLGSSDPGSNITFSLDSSRNQSVIVRTYSGWQGSRSGPSRAIGRSAA